MFNLDQIRLMLSHHGDFHHQLKMIHIGGTNGKGSTSLMIQHVLMQANFRVGLYTSPFDMGRFDNIRINDHVITPEEVQSMHSMYADDFERFGLSPFEMDTFLSLAYFYQEKVDFAVIEVGLGGIDDATNVIMPLVSVITNIGLDHQDVLGIGYQAIATKKAGIIKPKVPVVLGHDINDEALEVLMRVARENMSKVHPVKSFVIQSINPQLEFIYENKSYRIKSQADYQARNASLAIEVIHVLQELNIDVKEEHIQKGLAMGVPPKRFEWLSFHPMIVIDGAHNLEGTIRLIDAVIHLKLGKRIRVLAAILKDKPYMEMLDAWLHVTEHVTLTTFPHERALDLSSVSHPKLVIDSDYHHALTQIFEDPDALHIITGSLYFLTFVVNELKGMVHA